MCNSMRGSCLVIAFVFLMRLANSTTLAVMAGGVSGFSRSTNTGRVFFVAIVTRLLTSKRKDVAKIFLCIVASICDYFLPKRDGSIIRLHSRKSKRQNRKSISEFYGKKKYPIAKACDCGMLRRKLGCFREDKRCPLLFFLTGAFL